MRIATAITLALVACATLPAQTGQQREPKVSIAFNRFYDHAELGELTDRLVAAYPKFLRKESLGKSTGGRDLWLVTIQNPDTGPEAEKAAMYIDANIHGNEVQGGEVCIYTIWYLMENYGKIARITALVDERVFYIVPTVNPDGRDRWFHTPSTPHSSRTGISPTDNDRDGLLDEDPPEDLDGDGSITRMRKRVDRDGTHKVDPEDERFLVRVDDDEEGDYILLGSEGIDNDGDGRINEDDVGGYDMNRSNPADWQPGYIQYGAGPYPLYWPETRSVAAFLFAHPNIASVQSYHNAGGMILRGPGAAEVPEYPREDTRVYDELGKDGARILPFYRYMILYKDLYTVHGGFVNLAAETLGIISFTNELWTEPQRFSAPPKPEDRKDFNDLVMMGSTYTDWAPYEHPQLGSIEIGGWSQWSSRVPPAFMLEDLCHRNTAFTLNQAERMPSVSFGESQIEDLGAGVHRVRVRLENSQLIPTRTAMARQKRIGLPDLVSITADRVLAAGRVVGQFPDQRVEPYEKDLARIRLEGGIGSYGVVELEWIVEGKPPFAVEYESEKGGVRRTAVGGE